MQDLNTTENETKDKDSHIEDNSDIIDISELRGKEIWHYNMFDRFFSKCDEETIVKMINIIENNYIFSLRTLDRFVTRYCHLYNTIIDVNTKYCNQKDFNIYISYKAQLKSFTKNFFDPFKRKKKFVYTIENPKKTFLTTLGQLNFFRWAFTFGIIDYVEQNYDVIKSKSAHVDAFFKKHSCNNSRSSSKMTLTDNTTEGSDLSTIVNDMYKNNNTNIQIDKKNIGGILKINRNITVEI